MKILSFVAASLIGTASYAAPLDNNVINFIHATNQMEVEMTQIAIARSGNEDVKAYAKTVQGDHQLADRKILDLAKSEKLEVKEYVPDSPEEKAEIDADHALMQKLQTLSGAELDQAFLDGMYDGHVKAIEKLQGWRPDLQLESLANFIDETLPTLESHRDRADELRQVKH